jgi:hypothetical protein
MSDYYKLADKVVERAKELYYESDEDRSLSLNTSATTEKNMYTLASECVDKAMSELIVGEDDKWTLIRETCLDTNEVCYEGNFRCRFETPCNAFYNVCLHQLIEQLVR